MSDLFEQLGKVLDAKIEREDHKSVEVVVRRAGEHIACGCEMDESHLRSDRAEYRQVRNPPSYAFSYTRKRIACPFPAAFEVRGNVMVHACIDHLGFTLDYLVTENVNEMIGHFGRHSCVVLRKECKARLVRRYGEPFVELKECRECVHREFEEKRARERNVQRQLRNIQRRKVR